jgi:hypothetical protein
MSAINGMIVSLVIKLNLFIEAIHLLYRLALVYWYGWGLLVVSGQ